MSNKINYSSITLFCEEARKIKVEGREGTIHSVTGHSPVILDF
jgi:hypothetical protein